MNKLPEPEEAFRRLMLVARGLGFVFLVYFLPAFLRDAAGMAMPGQGLAGALTGDPAGPWWPLAISVATFLLSATFVLLHARVAQRADRPRLLLALDRRWWRDYGLGFLLGAAAATAAVLPLFVAGAIEIRGIGPLLSRPVPALGVFALLLLEGAREEMGFRGPSQRDLGDAIRVLPAAIFLAGSFALVHRANPDVTPAGLLGVFVAGLALAGIVRARGDLGMACGLHAGWNVFLGLVWSVRVSGHTLTTAALDTTSKESVWTGNSFGPEASPTGIAALALLAVLTWTRRPAEDRQR
jgi:membrane protease YdiL (CAAX protease family)